MNMKSKCDCPAGIKANCQCSGCSGKTKMFDPFHRYSIIMASAGTGKTYNLAMRYLQLLSFGINPEEILAVTFTRKAAGEIFDKIINRLLEMLSAPCACSFSSREKLSAILKKMLDGESELRISTIDSFFARLTQAFAPELGIKNDIQMIDENDNRPRKQIIRNLLNKASADELQELRELIKEANNDKQAGVSSVMNDLLKNVYKIYLEFLKDTNGIRNVWGAEIDQEKLFPLPSGEQLELLGEYFAVFAGRFDNDVTQRRFSALANFLKRGAKGTLPSDVSVLFDTLSNNTPGPWLNGTSNLIYSKRPKIEFSSPEELLKIRQAFKAIIAIQLKQLTQKSRAILSLMKKFDALYSKEIRENGQLTFKDLPFLLKNSDGDSAFHLSSSENINLEERLDSSINHYLFDEFQDTSDTQWYIFENLVSELLDSMDDRFRSFFCVGDIKQSIYQWRGGNPELFNQVVEKTTPAADALGYPPCRSLFESYRSSQDILDTSNRIFGDIRPDASELFKKSVQAMKYEKHKSKKEIPGFSTLISISSGADELKVKAKMMLDIIRRIDPFSPDKNLTVGVLQHKNKNMRNLADALITLADQENVDLAVSIDGWLTPRDSIAYAFLKQLLTIACHPADKKARVFLDMLTFDVEESKSPEILSIEDIACKLGFDNVSSIEQLSKAIRNDVFLNGTHGFVERFINAFKENLRNFDLKRLYTVRDLAAAYNGTPDEFIDAIEDWLHTQDQSVKKTVQFMTIHKAKGLEFDVVFLPDTEGNPPHSVAPEYARNAEITNGVRWINYLPTKSICNQLPVLEKHQRILDEENAFAKACKYYVALTRAKRAMYIFVTLPKKGTTYKFEAEMKAQLERFEPEDEYKISFETMKNRCGFYQDVSLVYASGLENWYDTVKAEKPENRSVPLNSAVKLIYPSRIKRLASHQEHESIYIPPEVRFSAADAADTGTRLHNLFEKIDFIDDAFDAGKFLADNAPEGELSPEVREIFSCAMAANSQIRAALTGKSGGCTLWKERRFLLKDDDGATIPGAFDRVEIYHDANGVPHEAVILDYKSDKVENSAELIRRHRKQLELYRRCLCRMTGIPESKIKICLAALRLGEIAEII